MTEAFAINDASVSPSVRLSAREAQVQSQRSITYLSDCSDQTAFVFERATGCAVAFQEFFSAGLRPPPIPGDAFGLRCVVEEVG